MLARWGDSRKQPETEAKPAVAGQLALEQGDNPGRSTGLGQPVGLSSQPGPRRKQVANGSDFGPLYKNNSSATDRQPVQ